MSLHHERPGLMDEHKSFRNTRKESVRNGPSHQSNRALSFKKGKSQLPKKTALFEVTEVECDEMIEAISQENASWKEEVKYLSRSWVKAIMAKPDKKNKDKRRPFDYAKKKIVDNLAWREEFGVSDQIAHYLSLEDGEEFSDLTANSHDLYWYGVDKDGSPNLWYRADRTNFRSVEPKKSKKAVGLMIQAALDRMPASLHNINVIVCFDEYNTFQAMKKPTLGPNFIKTFMKVCPDRLKSAYFVTGGLGTVFYNLSKKLAPSSIMDKVVGFKSRDEAAESLVINSVLTDIEVPTFMGGTHVQDEKIIQNYSVMIRTIEETMHAKVSSLSSQSEATASIVRGVF